MIRRRTPLKRSTKPIRRKRAKPRRGPLRDKGYLQFLREEGKCVACVRDVALHYSVLSVNGLRAALRVMYKPCDPAHGPVNGMRSKGPDNEALPLCRAHHEEQTRLNHRVFATKYVFTWELEAAAWYKAYQIYKETLA